MKVSNLALITIILTSLPKHASALKCGISFVTEDCLGDTDPRYDSEISYDLKEGDAFWKSREGLYVEDQCEYGGDGIPITKQPIRGFKRTIFGTWDFCNGRAMLNITVDGSRLYFNRWIMRKHNSDAVGNLTGVQLPGYISPSNNFAISSFEKNGEAHVYSFAKGWNQNYTSDVYPSTIIPVAGKAMLGMNPKRGDAYRSIYCVDTECSAANTYSESYVDKKSRNATKVVQSFQRISGTKVDKSTWMAAWEKAFTEYSILSSDQYDTILELDGQFAQRFTRPFDPITSESAPECSTSACPSEDDWVKVDPNFIQSPYVEPDGIITGGFIALITVLSILVACTIFYVVYTRGVEARERRVKVAVLKSLAATMAIKSSRKLTPSDLEKMFQKIDVDGNGHLDKSEVKGLVEEAGVANMSDRDYDLLFGSIDLDDNGTLDFAEFCAFFTSISATDVDSFKDQ